MKYVKQLCISISILLYTLSMPFVSEAAEEEASAWETSYTIERVTGSSPLILAARGSSLEDIRAALPVSYNAGPVVGRKYPFLLEWDLSNYSPCVSFTATARFNGQRADLPGVLWNLVYSPDIVEDYLTLEVLYIDAAPISDLHGRLRNMGGAVSASLYFNEYTSSGITTCLMPPAAEAVWLESSTDGINWSQWETQNTPEFITRPDTGYLIFLPDSTPRYYRIVVRGGIQDGVSNVIRLPDDTSAPKPSPDNSVPPSSSIGGDGEGISGNHGGGTALIPADRMDESESTPVAKETKARNSAGSFQAPKANWWGDSGSEAPAVSGTDGTHSPSSTAAEPDSDHDADMTSDSSMKTVSEDKSEQDISTRDKSAQNKSVQNRFPLAIQLLIGMLGLILAVGFGILCYRKL